MRADRLKVRNNRLMNNHDNFYLLTETSTQAIFQEIKKLKPQVVIVDSIQTLQSSYIESSPGTVSQIRECAAEFQRYRKRNRNTCFSDRSYYQRWKYCRSENSGTYGGYGIAI